MATIRSRGNQAVALRAPRLPPFSYWVAKLRIGVSAAVLTMVFGCESDGGGDSKHREPGSCAARSQVTCFSLWVSKLRIGVSAAVLIMVFGCESNGGDGSEAFVMNVLPRNMRKVQ